MKKLFGYLFMIAILIVPWVIAYWLFSHGKWISGLLVFWFSLFFSGYMIGNIVDKINLSKLHNLIIMAMLIVPWVTTYWLFSHEKYASTVMVFWLSFMFSIFFINGILLARNVFKQHDHLAGHDYEVVMMQLDRVEKVHEGYYSVYTKWVDPKGGAQYFFESDYIYFNPKLLLKDKEIPVKISIDDYTIYSVDLSMLPKRAWER